MSTIEEELEMSTDEALVSALTPKQVGDIELEPYGLMRQFIAQHLCEKNSFYVKCVVTVWLCTLSETEVLKADEDPTQAKKDAFAWGDTQRYSQLNFEGLLDTYKRLTDEVAASYRASLRDGTSAVKKTTGARHPP
jgi:hypothetical protein